MPTRPAAAGTDGGAGVPTPPPRHLLAVLATATAAACASLVLLVWISHFGEVSAQVRFLIDAALAQGIDPNLATQELFTELAVEEYGHDLHRYRTVDHMMRVILLCGMGLAAGHTYREWTRLRAERDPAAAMAVVAWLGTMLAFAVGIPDVGEDIEIFGAEDIKHSAYFALAIAFGVGLWLRYRHAPVVLAFGVGLVLHFDYLASELWPGTWGSSKLAAGLYALVNPLMDEQIGRYPAALNNALKFDIENALNKNWVAFAYVVAFLILSMHLAARKGRAAPR